MTTTTTFNLLREFEETCFARKKTNLSQHELQVPIGPRYSDIAGVRAQESGYLFRVPGKIRMDLKWDAKAIFQRQKLNFSQNPIFISQSLFLDFRGEKTQQKRQRRRSNNQKSLGVTNTFYFVLRYVMVCQSMYNSSHVRNEFPLTRPYGGASF